MNDVARLAIHREIETEGAGAPATNPLAEFVTPELLASWERDNANRHQKWVQRIKHTECLKAAQDVAALGNMLLLWIDANGELRARRVSKIDGVVREFLPDYARRTSDIARGS